MEKEKNKPLKVYASLKVNCYKVADPGVITFPVVCFNTDPAIVCAANDVKEITEQMYTNLVEQIENFETCGSGWSMKEFIDLDITLLHYNPLVGSPSTWDSL